MFLIKYVPLVATILAGVGLFRDERKRNAIVALIFSAAVAALIWAPF